MKIEDWIQNKVKELKESKTRTDEQELLLILHENKNRTAQENKEFDILVKYEKSLEQTNARKQAAVNVTQNKKKEERKSRDRKLYNAAGLLILAGLVDTKTGDTKLDAGELLGAFIGLANLPADHQKRAEWKKTGDAVLAEQK